MLLFYFFAAILVFLSYKSFRGGINYLNYFTQELAKPESNFTPFVSIIAPCRGNDEDLAENLSALFRQDYPCYEIIFVTDDEKDYSVPVINQLLTAYCSLPAKVVIAGKAAESSQKVHNLRGAVLEVSGESEAFVVVDSDARPEENWLRNLIAPLRDGKVGAATGYRWFVQNQGGLATHLRSVWNASIASALGANRKGNFCWGGSMAIRRETFDRLEMREKWRGT
jgi:cellulose synthase/poly-beta-1,6-N-acetylglucosamine synthase-like glycosyltransferase